MAFHKLVVPTINVNDDKVTLGSIEKENLEIIKKGDTLCSFETSKATEDFHSEYEGFVVWLAEAYDEISVGKEFCIIFDTKEEAEAKLNNKESVKNVLPADFKASKKAIEYAGSIGFDITLIKKDGIIKTNDIDDYLKKESRPQLEDNQCLNVGFVYSTTIRRIAIIGAGKCAMQIIDLISQIKTDIAVALFDDTPAKQNTLIDGIPVVGKIDFSLIEEKYKQGLFDYIIQGIGGHCNFRKKCFDELTSRGVPFCNIIHPTAVISTDVRMGAGNVLLPFSYVGPHACIGNDCFFTARTSVEHHNIIGSHCTFGPGVMLSGSVIVGDCTGFGAGIFVEPYVKIGANCLISSGSVLIKSVPNNVVVRSRIQTEFIEN